MERELLISILCCKSPVSLAREGESFSLFGSFCPLAGRPSAEIDAVGGYSGCQGQIGLKAKQKYARKLLTTEQVTRKNTDAQGKTRAGSSAIRVPDVLGLRRDSRFQMRQAN